MFEFTRFLAWTFLNFLAHCGALELTCTTTILKLISDAHILSRLKKMKFHRCLCFPKNGWHEDQRKKDQWRKKNIFAQSWVHHDLFLKLSKYQKNYYCYYTSSLL